ncbi:MAG TPA: AAA family ATPase [Myxococcota bacterium]|nr:AAA family ATPase [Myxococcota bacterium]
MRCIAVMNQKGGCGKTTTVVSLAGCLAAEGHSVLVVDMDPQAHATLGLGVDPEEVSDNLYDVLSEPEGAGAKLGDVIVAAADHLDVAPSGVILSALEQKLTAEGARGRTERLAAALAKLDKAYDFGLIDCPPNVGILTFNALRAAQEVIIPLETSYFSMHGVAKLLETIALLEDRIGHSLKIRILPTLFDGRTRFAKRALAEIRETYKDLVFDSVIRSNVRLREAAQRGVPIATLDRRSYGFVDYMSLALEVLYDREEDEAAPIPEPPTPPTDAEINNAGAKGVVFTFKDPRVRDVQLAGDFNNWVPDQGVETRQGPGGTWEKVVRLGPGVYQYRYFVDGEWTPDPSNPRRVEGPAGGVNSVLIIS